MADKPPTPTELRERADHLDEVAAFWRGIAPTCELLPEQHATLGAWSCRMQAAIAEGISNGRAH